MQSHTLPARPKLKVMGLHVVLSLLWLSTLR